MNKKQEELLDSATNQLPLRNVMNIATCYGKQPMAVPFSESDSPEQRMVKFHLNANSIYGKFGTGKGP